MQNQEKTSAEKEKNAAENKRGGSRKSYYGTILNVQIIRKCGGDKSMILAMGQIGHDDRADQFARLQADRKTTAAVGIVHGAHALILQVLSFGIEVGPCAKGRAFGEHDGVEFPVHPVLIAQCGALRTVLKEDVTVCFADADSHFDAGFAHAFSQKEPQIPGVVRGKMIKAEESFLLHDGVCNGSIILSIHVEFLTGG